MRTARLIFGVFLGSIIVLVVWFAGWVVPPEPLARKVAAISAVYPGPVGQAEVERIPCPPLRRVRIYLVCTADCEQVHRLVAVRGLQATPLANLRRTPPEDLATTRRRINAVIAEEGLRLDVDDAREMIGCFLAIEGLHPAQVLPEGGLEQVAEARSKGEEAMQRLADSLEDPRALARVQVEEGPEGFVAGMLYWETSRAGRPVLQVRIEMTRDGQVREVHTVQLAPQAPAAPAPGTGPDSVSPGPS